MISSRPQRVRRQLRALACFVVLAASGTALAVEPAEILSALAQVSRSDATFEETRTIAVLTAPVVRRGTLHYVRPAELTVVVESPVRERVRISGNAVTIEGRNGTREFRLADIPAVAAWVESVRATLAGDAAALGRYFTVRATGDLSRWTLELTPLTAELSTAVSRVVIDGTNAKVARIDVAEPSGDRSVMVISPAAAGKNP